MRYLILIALLMCLPVRGEAWQVVGGVASSGVTCSGDASSGDNESFEKGAGEFCTTDWTEADTDGAVNTYSTSGYNCGTHAQLLIVALSPLATPLMSSS